MVRGTVVTVVTALMGSAETTVGGTVNTGAVGGSFEIGLGRLPSLSTHANALPEVGVSLDATAYFSDAPTLGRVTLGESDHLGAGLVVGSDQGVPVLSGFQLSVGVGTPVPGFNGHLNLKSTAEDGLFDMIPTPGGSR